MVNKKRRSMIYNEKIVFTPFYADYKVIKYLFKEEALLAKANNTIENKKAFFEKKKNSSKSDKIYLVTTIFLN